MFRSSANLLSSGVPEQPFMSVSASMSMASTQKSQTRARPEDFARQLGIEEVEPRMHTRSKSHGLPMKFQSISGLTGPPSRYIVENPLIDPSLQHTAAAQMAELEPSFKVDQFFKVDHSPKTTRDPETLNVRILEQNSEKKCKEKPDRTEPPRRAEGSRNLALSDPNYIEKYRDKLIAPADSLYVKKDSMMGTSGPKRQKKQASEERDEHSEWFKRRPTSTTAHTFMFHANNIKKDIREHRRNLNYVLAKDPVDLHINTFKRGAETLRYEDRVDPITGVATGSLLPISSYLTSTPITNNLRSTLSKITKQGSKMADF